MDCILLKSAKFLYRLLSQCQIIQVCSLGDSKQGNILFQLLSINLLI